MNQTQLVIDDGAEPTDSTVPTVKVEMRRYRVIAEGGIFKAGRHWAQGDDVELEAQAGERLEASGDVESIR